MSNPSQWDSGGFDRLVRFAINPSVVESFKLFNAKHMHSMEQIRRTVAKFKVPWLGERLSMPMFIAFIVGSCFLCAFIRSFWSNHTFCDVSEWNWKCPPRRRSPLGLPSVSYKMSNIAVTSVVQSLWLLPGYHLSRVWTFGCETNALNGTDAYTDMTWRLRSLKLRVWVLWWLDERLSMPMFFVFLVSSCFLCAFIQSFWNNHAFCSVSEWNWKCRARGRTPLDLPSVSTDEQPVRQGFWSFTAFDCYQSASCPEL